MSAYSRSPYRLDALPLPIKLALCAVFLTFVGLYVWFFQSNAHFLILFAALIGGYMAINIGANDVANNVGPAVGSGAITLLGALCIAAIFEAAGALIAGGDVVSTIKKGIIDPNQVANVKDYVWLMAAALFAAAVWLNFATWLGAPVSTTHSIVGGVLGAGLAAGGLEIANWPVMGKIVASWVISPMFGGLIAAGMLFLIHRLIIFKANKITAAQKYVPYLIALMAWAFSVYLILKGIKKVWKADLHEAIFIGAIIALAVFIFCVKRIKQQANNMQNTTASVNGLFTIPLIFAAALLSFAHGANDVANAVGPLAAIVDAMQAQEIHAKASIPIWVMMVGAIGLSVGLLAFGPKLIRTVGSEITELDKSRGFCIVFASALTVIIASRLGLPVSSTHIALGGVFGVGFLREFLRTRYSSRLHAAIDADATFGTEKQNIGSMPIEDVRDAYKAITTQLPKNKAHKEHKARYKSQLVKRQHLYKIIAAWIITVPASGALSACLFYAFRYIDL